MKILTITRPFDAHVHFQRGEILQWVVPFWARICSYAVAMPSLIGVGPESGVEARDDKNEILAAAGKDTKFEPLVALKLSTYTTVQAVRSAYDLDCRVAKLFWYEHRDFEMLKKVLVEMEELGMILSVHAAVTGANRFRSETACLPHIIELARLFPRLKIVVEHITTKESAIKIKSLGDNIAATITPGGLCLTWRDVFALDRKTITNPYFYFNPPPQGILDQLALRECATSGDLKFFCGSDSVPHRRQYKECENPRPGIFDPYWLEILTGIFEKENALPNLENFVFTNGGRFYGLPENDVGKITLQKKSWRLPKQIEELVPFKAGETLKWQVV